MVVGCPKCKAKLKVPDERIKPEGSKFKCPKCRAMLMVRRPAKEAAPPSPPPRSQEPTAPPEEERPESGTFPETPETKEPPPSEQEPWPETPGEPEPPTPPSEGPVPPLTESKTEAPALPGAPPEEKAEEKAPAPEAGPEEEGAAKKILIAHPDAQTVNMLKFILMGANYSVVSALNGVDAMVEALKERPSVIVADVLLPKIHGIEMMKRLKSKSETMDIKIILTGTKAEEEVPPIKGAVAYIHQNRLQQGLVHLVKQALSAPPEAPPEASPEAPPEASTPRAAPAEERPAPSTPRPAAPADPGVQRAQRFARTVLSDIELYNKDKVAKSIQQGDFERTFAKEMQEGRKLYEMRIPEEVRKKGDFFGEAVQNFIEKKKKQLGV